MPDNLPVVTAPPPLILTTQLLAALAPHLIAAGLIGADAEFSQIVGRVARQNSAGAGGGRTHGGR